MPWIAAELPTLPALPVSGVAESKSDRTTITEFAGELEQRVSYAGHHAMTLNVTCNQVKAVQVDTFTAFWAGRKGSLLPFKYLWRGVTRYWRFEGTYSVNWKPPFNGSLTFALREVHPSEIVE